MSIRPWYKRFGSDFVFGTMGLTLEQRGAYSIIIDLIHDRGQPIPDDARFMSGILGVSMRKWRSIRDVLIEAGKIYEADGFLSNERCDRDLASPMREPVSASVRGLVFQRDGRRCVYCGAEDDEFHIDHIHPVALGGDSSIQNLAVACRSCNLSKGAKPLSEWLQ